MCSAQVRDWNAMLREAQKLAASQSESWVTKNTKACPGCKAPIQKNGGCNHVTCTRCQGHFCWVQFLSQVSQSKPTSAGRAS